MIRFSYLRNGIWDNSKVPVSGPSILNPDLPFDMPWDDLAISDRELVMNWFPAYPVSLENGQGATANSAGPGIPADQYISYYNPTNTNSVLLPSRGILRDRPIIRPYSIKSTWQLDDCILECNQALAFGVNVFNVDILGTSTSSNYPRSLVMAKATSLTGMKICAMLDFTSLRHNYTAAQLVTVLNEVSQYGNGYMRDGRLVVFVGAPEWAQNLQLFVDIATTMQAAGKPIAYYFFPIANATNASHLEKSDNITTTYNADTWKTALGAAFVARSWWGSRNRQNNSSLTTLANNAHAANVEWLAPVAWQDSRPNQQKFDEAEGVLSGLLMWKSTIDGGADLAHGITWNDYSENAQHAPSQRTGYFWLMMDAYQLVRWKTGAYPTVVRDTVGVVHRNQPLTGVSPTYPSSSPMPATAWEGTAAADWCSVVAFATAACTVNVTIGGVAQDPLSCPGPGMFTKQYAMQLGTAHVELARGGATVVTVDSAEASTITPSVQDRLYVGKYAVAAN